MVVIHQIDARGSVLALTRTVVQVFGTGSATPTLQASALEAARLVMAGVRVDAGSERRRWIRVAFVNVCEEKKNEIERSQLLS